MKTELSESSFFLHGIRMGLMPVLLLVLFITAGVSRGEEPMKMKAVPFPDHLKWVNSEPLTLEALRGHVILLDFWTYCCINCIHVLPDLAALEERFKDRPVVVIGVHSPKFENEKIPENVQSAINRYDIRHPVVMDNRLSLWRQYGIRAWPSFLLIDPEGYVIGQTSGEGRREVLESAIHQALVDGDRRGILAEEPLQISLSLPRIPPLYFPGKLALDPERRILYVSNSNRHQIWAVALTEGSSGQVIEKIGYGEPALHDGDYSTARFNQPQGIAWRDDRLFVADTRNHALREIDLKSRTVRTLAGSGVQGYQRNYRGPAGKASLNSPWDVAIGGNRLYIAMAGTHQIWEMDLKSGDLRALIGNGAENIVDGGFAHAQLAQPSGLAFSDGKLYFADSEVSAIRKADFNKMQVETLSGTGLFDFGHRDGPMQKALFQHPLGVEVVDSVMWIADTYNHAIRRLDLGSGLVETVIGRHDGTVCRVDDAECAEVPLFEPNDVIADGNRLLIADTNNHLIRLFDLDTRTLSTLELTDHEAAHGDP